MAFLECQTELDMNWTISIETTHQSSESEIVYLLNLGYVAYPKFIYSSTL